MSKIQESEAKDQASSVHSHSMLAGGLVLMS